MCDLEVVNIDDLVSIKAGKSIPIRYKGSIKAFCASERIGGYIVLKTTKGESLAIPFNEIKSMEVIRTWQLREETAIGQARALGFSIAQVARLSGVIRETLLNWHKSKPELFAVALEGCMAALSSELPAIADNSPSEYARQAGLHSLKELSDISSVKAQTLYNWHKKKPRLFTIVTAGCAVIKKHNDQQEKVRGLT